MKRPMHRLCKSRILFLVIVVISLAPACATVPEAKPFTPGAGFSLKGAWDWTFTSASGVYRQEMAIEDERDGEIRGTFVGYRGGRSQIRGKVRLPEVTFTLQGVDFTVTLVSEDRMEGWTWRSPGGGEAGQFVFVRKPPPR
jgi:hypothetical protein